MSNLENSSGAEIFCNLAKGVEGSAHYEINDPDVAFGEFAGEPVGPASFGCVQVQQVSSAEIEAQLDNTSTSIAELSNCLAAVVNDVVEKPLIDPAIASAVAEVLNEVHREALDDVNNGVESVGVAPPVEETRDFLHDEKTSDSKKSHGSQSKKRRRRILVDSDESDTERREAVLRSPSPCVVVPENTESNESLEALEAKVNEAIASEKPGPKSKKTSTHLLKQLEAKNLLQNAVVIPARKRDKDSKKHKKFKRVLDSDDEQEKSVQLDVSDIGMIGDDVTCGLGGAMLPENLTSDPNFVPLEAVNEVCEVVSFENPILPQDDCNLELEKMQNEAKEANTSSEEESEKVESEPEPEDPALNEEPIEEPSGDEDDDETETKSKKSHKNSIQHISTATESIALVRIPAKKVKIEESDEETESRPKKSKTIIKEEPVDAAEAENFLADALKSQFADSPKHKIKKEIKAEVDFSQNNSTFWGRDSTSESDWPDDLHHYR